LAIPSFRYKLAKGTLMVPSATMSYSTANSFIN
jgi:hypothetical protein